MANHKRYRQIKREIKELLVSSGEEEDGRPDQSIKFLKLSYDKSSDPSLSFSGQQSNEETSLSPLALTASQESSTDDESHHHKPDRPLKEGLTAWASKNNITHQALNKLLELLRKTGHDLPKDSHTLMETPKYVELLEKRGHYFYFGIEPSLHNILRSHPEFKKENDSGRLNVNIDGHDQSDSPDQRDRRRDTRYRRRSRNQSDSPDQHDRRHDIGYRRSRDQSASPDQRDRRHETRYRRRSRDQSYSPDQSDRRHDTQYQSASPDQRDRRHDTQYQRRSHNQSDSRFQRHYSKGTYDRDDRHGRHNQRGSKSRCDPRNDSPENYRDSQDDESNFPLEEAEFQK